MTAPFNEYGPFAVGEICRIVGSISFPELIGVEVQITAPLHRIVGALTGEVYFGYGANLIHKDIRVAPEERFLRRRKPPAADSNERTFMQKWRDMADKAPQRVEVPA